MALIELPGYEPEAEWAWPGGAANTPPGDDDYPPSDDDAPDAPPKSDKREAPKGNATPPDRGFQLIEVDDIFAPLPPTNWLVQGIDLCPGAPALVAGYGFSGKTVAMQQLAVDIATGGRVLGCFACRKGRVVHIDYEQGSRLTRKRYQRIAAAAMLAPQDFGRNLALQSMPLVYLDTVGAEEALVRIADGSALLIIDSLRAAAPSVDENSSEVRRGLDCLNRVSERTECSVIVIHHARKPQQNSTGGAKMAIRGSGAIFDACSSVLVFESSGKDDPVRVSHEKARESGKTGDDLELTIEDIDVDGCPTGGLRVSASAAPSRDDIDEGRKRARADEQDERVFEAVMRDPWRSGRSLAAELHLNQARDVSQSLERLLTAKRLARRKGNCGADQWGPCEGGA
jgi:hypothetical protein